MIEVLHVNVFANKENIMGKSIKKIIYIAYISAMLTIYPMVMHDMYFDVTDTKLMAFYIVTIPMIVFVFIHDFVFSTGNLNCRNELIFFGILCADIIISFIINGAKYEMLINEMEYGVGIIFILILLLACVALLYLIEDGDNLPLAYLASVSAVLVGSFTLLQFTGVDIGNMIGSISPEERFMFLGPLGNVANLGCYAVMLFPICSYSITRKDRIDLRLLGCLGIILSSATSVVSNTDGTLLALAVALLLMGIILCKKDDTGADFYFAIFLTAISFTLIKIINECDSSSRILDTYQKILIFTPVILFMYLISIPVLVMCLVGKKKILSFIFAVTRWVCIIQIIIVCMMPIIICIYTFTHSPSADSSLTNNILYFGNSWGTDRGYLWKSAIDIYKSGSFLQLLFGRGPSGFFREYISSYYDYAVKLGLYPNYDAHNIYLQLLCEYGIVGIVSAAVLIVCRLKKCFENKDTIKPYKAISLIAAMVASLFMVLQNVTLAFLPIII